MVTTNAAGRKARVAPTQSTDPPFGFVPCKGEARGRSPHKGQGQLPDLGVRRTGHNVDRVVH
eukprot:10513567-Lingulodinium_polyedra.AAC.1